MIESTFQPVCLQKFPMVPPAGRLRTVHDRASGVSWKIHRTFRVEPWIFLTRPFERYTLKSPRSTAHPIAGRETRRTLVQAESST
ncbi:hypothetical protein TNCT_524441 [Trichonephila clavata]|uniref:Uncharacterized protein n=1 Tax=Trichonephila clavata TaxID=2740835 RepID=A0A8X6L8I8_TRICU|nr:hypothetical protein TNCT_524441 [Trichonephila clavata]